MNDEYFFLRIFDLGYPKHSLKEALCLSCELET